MSDPKLFNSLFSVVGPTAVGKTDFALWLVSQLAKLEQWSGFDIVSADSRQVYQGIEILSGADIPAGFQLVSTHDKTSTISSYFEKDLVRFYGVSMILPNQEWSVTHFQQMAREVIQHAYQHHRFVVMVGGTGLYHRHLLNTDPVLKIPPNKKLRKQWENVPLVELQQALQKQDRAKFESMNHSDQQNPRRLLRALEVSQYKQKKATALKRHKVPNLIEPFPDFRLHSLGLTDELPNIKKRIQQRVLTRFENGAVQEVATLLQLSDLSPLLQTATGFVQIEAYLEGKLDAQQCLDQWTLKEFQYAKRQQTWWKKEKDVNWFQIAEQNWQELAFEKVLAILGL